MDPPVSSPSTPFDELITREIAFPGQQSYLPPGHSLKEAARPLTAEKFIATRSPHNVPIEDRLMRKSREAKIRFAMRKKEIEAEQLKEMKPTPTINPTSRKIAEQNFLSRFFPDKSRIVMQQDKFTAQDFHTATFPPPQPQTPSFLTSLHRADVQTERQESVEREQRETFVMVPRCHVSLPEGTSTKVYLPIRLGPTDRYDVIPSDSSHLHPDSPSPQPPLHPLDMTPEQRSQYFLQLKEKKLQQEADRIRAEELKECSFKPDITRRRLKGPNLSGAEMSGEPSVAMSDRSRCSQSSYTDRFQKRQELNRLMSASKPQPKDSGDGFRQDEHMRVPPPNPMMEAALPRAQPGPPMDPILSPFYSPLSPTAQNIGFRAGCDFLALQDKLKGSRK